MKSEEEMVNDLISLLDRGPERGMYQAVCQALHEFADERVRAVIFRAPWIKQHREEARNAALDEAAQLVSSYMYEKGLSVSLIDLAEQIRALKK